MTLTVKRFVLWCAAPLVGLAVGCGPSPEERAVRALAPTISGRANLVLKHLLSDFAVVDGRWQHDMGPGCTGVWAARFGYEVGRRRDRQDIVRIGQVTGSEAAAAGGRAIWQAVRSGLRPKTPMFDYLLPRIPALWISGTRGEEPAHLAACQMARPMIAQWAQSATLHPVQSTALALFFADSHRFQKTRQADDLPLARRLAEQVDASGYSPLSAMAWAWIARASGDAADLRRAKVAAAEGPHLTCQDGAVRFAGPYANCLSFHLAFIHAYTDLAELEPDGPWRRRALDLLEYVFSDAYFDGYLLAHHWDNGPVKLYCSGCNFHALYVADRALGGALVLDPAPKPRVLRPAPATKPASSPQ